MKLSKKLKTKLKKNTTIALTSIALVTTTLAALKLADISMPVNTLSLLESDNKTSATTINRLPNTETVTYIYDAADLVAFRDEVNAGDNYSGKTVYLMNDIDLSTVCSSTLGSWVPINSFAGTFVGNNNTINGLYINSSSAYQGLFLKTSGKISNLKLKNVYVKSTGNYNGILSGSNSGEIYGIEIISGSIYGNNGTGGIVGYNTGNIILCSNKASVTYTASTSSPIGGIVGYSSGTVKQCINSGTVQGNHPVGGVVGSGNGGSILQCINTGTVKTIYYNATNNHGIAGGIIGMTSGKLTINSCYNKGTVTGNSTSCQATGGIIGHVSSGTVSGSSIKNCYNIGTISTSGSKGGIIAGFHDSGKISYSNNYWLSGCGATYGISQKSSNTGTATITATNLKTYTVTLGNAFAYDVYNKNSGYPVLAWQNETTVMSINKNQAYIGVGESLSLNVIEKDEVTEIIGENYEATNFTWTSTNEDVATVNENGVVTGVSDGYTTIYAYHETSGLYAMCVVNVAKGIANPQIETGNGFTVILKADGTVWTIGNNAKGTIGNGTIENVNVPTSVYIDEDTALNNIVKIAVGTDHVLALTKNGNVYAWGANSYGQLGQNNTNSLSYAKLVLGEDGATYLSNIVDIVAGAYGSSAIDKDGNVYVWGNGSYGEIGNNATTSKNLPTKTTIKNAIQVSMGQGQVAVLTSEGVVWSWGRNNNGQLGINCTNNTSYPMKTALNVTELSAGGYHTMVKKIDGTMYAVGCYSNGRLGTGSTADAKTYVKVNLPSTVTEDNKVKYV
ncbi:MAG: Ig-like domain-containing protein, partial [Clostridia bacterium]|nr:Ig-like domain-containing protein [Clostridia bacterium]